MDRIYEESKVANSKSVPYFAIPPCVRRGDNPALNEDGEGHLTTPAYVVAIEGKDQGVDKLYIHYIFFYGYNPPFDIKVAGYHVASAGQHDADIEHITVQLDAQTKKLERIFYAAHGSEGVWYAADSHQVSYEGETHPVVYAAKRSHANYTKAGVYVRIFGFANDATERGLEWKPKLIRLYLDNDPRFNPASMGWISHHGTYGEDAVGSLGGRGWLLDPSSETSYPENIHYCQDGALWCIYKNSPVAFPP